MTTKHDYRKIAAIVGEEKINALREAGVKIGDKPTKPTTGLLGRWVKDPRGNDVMITQEEPYDSWEVYVTYRSSENTIGVKTALYDLDVLVFPEETTRPEDVPAGEAWLVKVDQGEYIVGPVYAFKHSESHWTIRKSRFSHEYEWPNADVTLVAPLVPARPEPQSEHPRTLSSLEDYEAVPAGTVVAEPGGWPCTKTFGGDWYRGKTWLTDREMADTERQVLREGWGE